MQLNLLHSTKHEPSGLGLGERVRVPCVGERALCRAPPRCVQAC